MDFKIILSKKNFGMYDYDSVKFMSYYENFSKDKIINNHILILFIVI